MYKYFPAVQKTLSEILRYTFTDISNVFLKASLINIGILKKYSSLYSTSFSIYTKNLETFKFLKKL